VLAVDIQGFREYPRSEHGRHHLVFGCHRRTGRAWRIPGAGYCCLLANIGLRPLAYRIHPAIGALAGLGAFLVLAIAVLLANIGLRPLGVCRE